ncbi:hypothetical protein VTN00DRAFT_557 [Thermoascus crustaceus]|uniref:uncharacterized protein n=1 Tax=Thermoascus crustaceus TaxID=5088 RepID=UPI00374251BE
MLSPAQWDSVNAMSYPHGSSGHPHGMDDYVEDTSWTCEAPPFIHPYSTGGYHSGTILTPSSLPDSSYADARPSPVLSHHSPDYQYQCIGDSVEHGLGISGPFPGSFPTASGFGYSHGHDIDYGASQAISSPQPQRTRRGRRAAPPIRETPVTILPHPEGLQRLQEERRQGQLEAQRRDPHRSRAVGRGRRNPQAEEEDVFVERLRQQNLSWKIVTERFRERFNKDTSEARLQMRMLRRRKERSAMWDEDDVSSIAYRSP